MTDDALKRLEAWLGACPDELRYATFDVYSGVIVVLLDSHTDQVEASAPDLPTAIHAALDRAEEAGL